MSHKRVRECGMVEVSEIQARIAAGMEQPLVRLGQGEYEVHWPFTHAQTHAQTHAEVLNESLDRLIDHAEAQIGREQN